MLKRRFATVLLIVGACSAAGAATPHSASDPAAKAEQPVAAEKNPPGDIPDNQAFVEYRSPLGFSIKVPEGWARRENPGDVSFSDKYNRAQVALSSQPSSPTVASLKADQFAALQKSPHAIRVVSVMQVALPAGTVSVVHYGSNSDVNPVTNKAIRLDNTSYYFWKAGRLATLTVSAPAGADNADQWQLMARSFAWR